MSSFDHPVLVVSSSSQWPGRCNANQLKFFAQTNACINCTNWFLLVYMSFSSLIRLSFLVSFAFFVLSCHSRQLILISFLPKHLSFQLSISVCKITYKRVIICWVNVLLLKIKGLKVKSELKKQPGCFFLSKANATCMYWRAVVKEVNNFL